MGVAEAIEPTTAFAITARCFLLVVVAEMTGRVVDDRNLKAAHVRQLIPLQNALAPVTPPQLELLRGRQRYVPATPGSAATST